MRLLRQALDVGFRNFDVAPSYGNGLNEAELGRVLSGYRMECKVTTKFGIPVDLYGDRFPSWFFLIRGFRILTDWRYGDEYKRRVFSADEMERSLEGSLRRLKRDHVDDFLIHEPLGPLTKGEVSDLHDKAGRLKEQGKIIRWGVAGPAVSIAQLGSDPMVDVVQFPLEDVAKVPVAPSRRRIAYGAYRTYLASRSGRNDSFTTFVRDRLHRDGPDLIVSTTAPARLASFREFFL